MRACAHRFERDDFILQRMFPTVAKILSCPFLIEVTKSCLEVVILRPAVLPSCVRCFFLRYPHFGCSSRPTARVCPATGTLFGDFAAGATLAQRLKLHFTCNTITSISSSTNTLIRICQGHRANATSSASLEAQGDSPRSTHALWGTHVYPSRNPENAAVQ